MPIHHVLELISREEWGAQTLPTGNRLISSNVVYLLIHQTGEKNCFNSTGCIELLKQMQVNKRATVTINFVVYLLKQFIIIIIHQSCVIIHITSSTFRFLLHVE